MRADLLTLKLFVSAYEELSISKAADREHIAASALSKRLSMLEASTGAMLFHRLRNGLGPTPAADALLRHARLILRDVAQMESELQDFTSGMKGHVRVFSNIWGITQYLPGDLSSFLASHPKVHVDLREGTSSEIVRSVDENAADIGIIAGEVSASGLKTLPYRSDRLVVVVSPDHPLAERERLSLPDLLIHEVIGHRQDSAIDRLLSRAAEQSGQVMRQRIAVSGFEAVSRMAEANIGVGLVPQECARRYLANTRLVARPLDEPWATRTLYLCHLPLENLPMPARMLIDHLHKAGSQDATAPR